MKTSLDDNKTQAALDTLADANQRFLKHYPGDSTKRQPLHTVYGGAQLFKAETTTRLGQLALASLDRYAPTADVFAAALGLPSEIAETVHTRTRAKLEREPVEDFRIDFEDGYGNRPDAEEDAEAERTAKELARALASGVMSPYHGIRIKPLNEELKRRSVRTTDIFVSTLLAETGGAVPENFVITLPKVTIPEQVSAFCDLLEQIEDVNGLARGAIDIELMIEMTQSILDSSGRSNLPALLAASRGRMVAAHFGTYDYTAGCNITAEYQAMDHATCDFAKHMMMVAYAQTGIFLSDGATNIMPVGPHAGRDVTPEQEQENTRVVHNAWRTAYAHVRHSLKNGFYQGWDLHPAQLPVRYAACFSFFLEGLDAASERLSNFMGKAAQATLVGDVFDDAATGQGLLNYFLRALNSGAIDESAVTATGLTIEEIQTRSFAKIVERRRDS